jgi:hypothetical protein
VESELRGYAPQRDPYGELRTNILNLYTDHIQYIRNLDTLGPKRQDLPVQDFTELSQLIGQLIRVLVSLNPTRKMAQEERTEGVDDFIQLLPQVELIIKDLQRKILTHIKKRTGRR